MTISIDMGRTARGDPATLDLEELLATRRPVRLAAARAGLGHTR